MFGVPDDSTVLLYVGRISDEKGIFDLPYVYERVKKEFPDIRLVIAGKGPDEDKLKEQLPDAKFLGWIDHDSLPDIYSAGDMLLMPSRFDTFGNVIVEAFACGCPVISYSTKGPRDIIGNEKSGYLVNTREKMAETVIAHFKNTKGIQAMRDAALARAGEFTADSIISKLLKDTDLV
jgi:glycosyltransferase involved in cell wall biosynthesis